MDQFLFQTINQLVHKSDFLDFLSIFIARYGAYFLIILLLFLFRKKWKLILGALASGFLARIFVSLIRFILPQERPFVSQEVNLLFSRSPKSSFPSGHTAFFFALSTFLFISLKKKSPKYWRLVSFTFFFLSFLIGFFRVLSGIHWPSDILGGIFIGILSGWLISFVPGVGLEPTRS